MLSKTTSKARKVFLKKIRRGRDQHLEIPLSTMVDKFLKTRILTACRFLELDFLLLNPFQKGVKSV